MRLALRGAFRRLFVTTLFLATATSLQAATVTYTLALQPNAGTWQVFGEASPGDNAGLSLVGVPLTNVDFPVDLQLPQGRLTTPNVGVEAFISGRVDDVSPIGGSQDTVNETGLVYGFGQTGGSLSMGTVYVQQDYDAKLLIAQGTFDANGPLPTFSGLGAANVFVNDSGVDVVQADIVYSTVIPEPTSLLLMLFGSGWIAVQGRRSRRAG